MADTLDMDSSKSAVVFTAAAPTPATVAVTGRNFFPTPSISCPTFWNLSPAALICCNVVLAFPAWSSRDLSCCSVSAISLCRASYCSGATGFPNSSDTSLADFWSVFNSLEVFLISSCRASYFSCDISPFANCSSAFLDCSFRSPSFFLVSSICFLIGSYFSFQAS